MVEEGAKKTTLFQDPAPRKVRHVFVPQVLYLLLTLLDAWPDGGWRSRKAEAGGEKPVPEPRNGYNTVRKHMLQTAIA